MPAWASEEFENSIQQLFAQFVLIGSKFSYPTYLNQLVNATRLAVVLASFTNRCFSELNPTSLSTDLHYLEPHREQSCVADFLPCICQVTG